MLILLKNSATDAQIEAICDRVRKVGLTPGMVPGARRTAVAVTGNTGEAYIPTIAELPGVLRVIKVTKPYRLATLEGTEGVSSVVDVGTAKVGSINGWYVAGPCSVDTPERLLRTALHLKRAGVQALRGGAFKPRTSPYAFHGHGVEALKWMREVGDEVSMPIVTETMELAHVDAAEEYADVLQIGARNMQNYGLLRRVGESRKPVLLKRGLAATLDEFLNAAEYILAGGNPHVILCERGIRTFGTHARFTLDVAAVAALKERTHLPVIVDPSHPAGKRSLVEPLARAGLAAGADGIIVEVHPEPEQALSDGQQALRFEDVAGFGERLRGIAGVLGGTFGDPPVD